MKTVTPIAFIVLVLLWIPCTAASQEPQRVGLFGTELHRIQSAEGVDYDLYIELPMEYETEPDAEYPVVYITDPSLNFPIIVMSYRYMRFFDDVRPAILVGVTRPVDQLPDYTVSRHLDYTPTHDPAEDLRYGAVVGQTLQSGGGVEFLRVLTEDVGPWVEGRYRTSEERGLVGFSLGGMFAAYVLLTAPEAFTHYLIGSPFLVWDDGYVLDLEVAYAAESRDLDARVFISAGDQEHFEDPPEAWMVSRAIRLAERLASRQYPSLELEYRVFEDETHGTVVPIMLSRGLRFLFGTN